MTVKTSSAFKTSRTFRTALVAAAGGFMLLAPVGCGYYEGGPGYSADQFTYVSTSWRPYTITLKDTRTGQDFWSIDVPVGKELVVQFFAGEGTKDSFTPDLMKWAILNAGDTDGDLSNSMPVPDKYARRLDPTIRPTPELPEGMTPYKKPPASIKAPDSRGRSGAEGE